uniref:Uncharacterized protein n=1 Tax=Onchocerca volvulus TaxID=6282 RepID=A0A8R1TQQ5_ONCVO
MRQGEMGGVDSIVFASIPWNIVIERCPGIFLSGVRGLGHQAINIIVGKRIHKIRALLLYATSILTGRHNCQESNFMEEAIPI